MTTIPTPIQQGQSDPAQRLILRPATMQDLEVVADLFNRHAVATTGAPETNVERLRRGWTTPGFDPTHNVRLAVNSRGEALGVVKLWDLDEPPLIHYVACAVHPEHLGRGIGTALNCWAHDRARESLHRAPPGARVVVHSYTVSGHEPTRRLFESLGMRLIRHSYHMVIDLQAPIPEPRWPAGISLRPFAPERDAEAVFRAEDEAFQDHFGYVEEPFETAFPRWRHYRLQGESFDPALWFVAVQGDQIAGLSICRLKADDDPQMGWISSLCVRRPWRRRGLALALLLQSFRAFRERGQQRAGLGVDASNLTGATRLYQRAGMRIQRQYDLYELELRPGKELATVSLE